VLQRNTAADSFTVEMKEPIMSDQQVTHRMKPNRIRVGRLIPWLGVALLSGLVIVTATYVNSDPKSRDSELSASTVNRLIRDQQLSLALKRLHNGQVAAAAQSLDLLLCGDILLTNGELDSFDPETQMRVRQAFRSIGMTRPNTQVADTGSTQEHIVDQIAAQRILTLALATPKAAEPK
jgi:hypothetical protein